MSFSIGDAFRDAGAFLTGRAGISFIALYWLTTSLSQAGMESMIGTQGVPLNVAVFGSGAVAGAAYLVGVILTMLVLIGQVRFLGTETDRVGVDLFTGEARTLAHVFVGGVVLLVAVMAGFLLFVVPGIFLLVSLIWFQFVVIEEETDFLSAYRESWAVATGNRIATTGLVAVLFVAAVVVVGVPLELVKLALGTGLSRSVNVSLGLLLQVFVAMLHAFMYTALYSAYCQISAADS